MASPTTDARPRLDAQELLEVLSSDGLLSQSVRGFEVRDEQRAMMADIIAAYNDQQIALIEAGTGTGKSLAYLLPAMLWAVRAKQRTVISTNTINLQEQLLSKDIPLLRDALGLNLRAVLVKGMSNYLCLRKHEEAMEEINLLNVFEAEELQQIDAWQTQTSDGTRTSLPMVPQGSTWEKVMAESDTCSGKACPHFAKCFFFKARAEAEDAQILVVNHHLLFSDLAARASDDNYEDACILPAYHRVILDEAHNIEDIATEFFAEQANLLNALRILGRLGNDGNRSSQGRIPQLKQRFAEHFGKSQTPEISSIYQRLDVDLPAQRRQLANATAQTFRLFSQFAVRYAGAPEFGEDIQRTGVKLRLREQHYETALWKETLGKHVKEYDRLLQSFIYGMRAVRDDILALDDEDFRLATQGLFVDLRAMGSRLEGMSQMLSAFLTPEPNRQQVRWIERIPLRTETNVRLVNADLDITSALVNALFTKFPTVVLCSATLSTNRDFSFMKKRLGLVPQHIGEKAVIERIYESPFDYGRQALLAMPSDLPGPSSVDFVPRAAEAIWRLIQASHGHAFVLFTSYSTLRQVWQILHGRMQSSPFRFMKQGDAARKQLLETFRTTQNAVLFGTDSFWEGVDVAGEALRSVIIVKLPFRVPTEPIVEARTESILAEGGQPFMDYSLPCAIMKFKQGFGRLIRHRKDRGCITCLDTRLLTKGYGKQFLNSLPGCQQVVAPMETVFKEMWGFYKRTDPKGNGA
ncbi:MAG: DEAD/DEAH box helicase family protein [Chlamydiia bacterium]|nr:DEAD/DEAH box helicase family protein [Chlamydiia bacterium]